jgi:hypothetical protein
MIDMRRPEDSLILEAAGYKLNVGNLNKFQSGPVVRAGVYHDRLNNNGLLPLPDWGLGPDHRQRPQGGKPPFF